MNDDAYIIIHHGKAPRTHLSQRQLAAILVTVSLFIIALLIGILVTVSREPSMPDVVDIVNYDDLPVQPPDNTKDELTASLYYLLDEYFDAPDQSHSIKATLRPETLEQQEIDNINSMSFIVDVDAYQQSYQVTLSWTADGTILPENTSVECASHDVSKYPSSVCHGQFYDSTSPYLYLPYEGTLATGQTYSANYLYEDEAGAHVSVSVDVCGAPSASEAALSAIESYLASKGVDVDSIQYDVRSVYHNCIIEG